ncbi:MAG: very short patch repair endonuclease [Gemmatimonadetes bacterium]|nr:MAG: very short patch repair endonuclease [Gemmatimonadota bacterium]
MTDVLTPEQRRRCMARIRGKDTSPEIIVRTMIRALGYSFRTHVPGLPGRPDIVLGRLHRAIFVHGCFWHRHSCTLGQVFPSTRAAFWRAKLVGNKERDARTIRALRRRGWKVLVVWECQTREPTRILPRLTNFLRV